MAGVSFEVVALEARLTPAVTVTPAVAFAGPLSPEGVVLLEPHGGVVVAEPTQLGNADEPVRTNGVRVSRYDGFGQLDASFGQGGHFDLPLAVADYVPVEVAARPGGYAVLLLSQSAVTVANVPLNGSAAAFSITTIPTGFRPHQADLAVAADNSVHVVARTAPGYFQDERPVAATTLQAARVTPQGQLDPNFARVAAPEMGPFATAPGQPDRTRSLVVLPDGTVLLGTASAADGTPGGVTRLRADLTPDVAFGGDGHQHLTSDVRALASVERLAALPGGSVLAYGTLPADATTQSAAGRLGAFTRLTADGAFDLTFGTGGTAVYATDAAQLRVLDLVTRASGETVVLGGQQTPAGPRPLIATVSDRGQQIRTLTLPSALPDSPVIAGERLSPGQLHVAQSSGVFRFTLPPIVPDPAVVRFDPSRQPRTPQSLALSGGDVGHETVLRGQADGPFLLEVGTLVPVGFRRGAGVRVARADIDNDGRPDTIFGSGPGAADVQVVLATGQALSVFQPFESGYAGGLNLTAANLDGDGFADLVVTPDVGGGPVVAVYSGARLAQGLTDDAAQLTRYYGIADPAFRGGARVAVGDVTRDARPDLIVAAGPGGGPRVTAWDGPSTLAGSPRPVADFFAYDESLRGGVHVAAGHFTAPGQVATGPGDGGGPHVKVFNTLDAPTGPELASSFMASDESTRAGVRVGAIDHDGDRRDELVTTTGPATPGRVRVHRGITPTGGELALDIAVFAGEDLPHGVYVG